MDKIVSNRTESAWSERKDLLALMLLASDREANKLSKSELIADTFIFLFAGPLFIFVLSFIIGFSLALS